MITVAMVTENGIRNRLKLPKPELSDSDIGLRHNAQQCKGAIIIFKESCSDQRGQ